VRSRPLSIFVATGALLATFAVIVISFAAVQPAVRAACRAAGLIGAVVGAATSATQPAAVDAFAALSY
jgi:hypothetical protein